MRICSTPDGIGLKSWRPNQVGVLCSPGLLCVRLLLMFRPIFWLELTPKINLPRQYCEIRESGWNLRIITNELSPNAFIWIFEETIVTFKVNQIMSMNWTKMLLFCIFEQSFIQIWDHGPLVLQYLIRAFLAVIISDLDMIMKCLNSCSYVKAV